MNTLTRWDPFKEMNELQNRLSKFFGRTPLRGQNGEQENMTVAEWAPLVDITEDDKEYLIKAELPEVKKDAVKVTVENGILTITGERKFEKEEKGKKYNVLLRGECSTLNQPLIGNKEHPDIAEEYVAQFKTLHSLNVDVPLGIGSSPAQMYEKTQLMAKNPEMTNPFIDPQGFKAYVDNSEKSFLSKLEEQKRKEQAQIVEDSKADIGWGNQIRSYVLDQSRVKDLRTNHESGRPQQVLDGDLDDFLQESLKQGL